MISETTLYLTITLLTIVSICMIVMTSTTRGALVAGLLIIFSSTISVIGVSYFRGTPKLSSSETARPAVAKVVWYGAIKNERIYLLLTWEGQREPKYYWTPWTTDLEKNIEKGQQNAKANHSSLMVRDPFGGKMGDMTTPSRQKGSNGRQGDNSGGANTSGGTNTGNSSRSGHSGAGTGNQNGDNEGAESRFYAPAPLPLPEKIEEYQENE